MLEIHKNKLEFRHYINCKNNYKTTGYGENIKWIIAIRDDKKAIEQIKEYLDFII